MYLVAAILILFVATTDISSDIHDVSDGNQNVRLKF